MKRKFSKKTKRILIAITLVLAIPWEVLNGEVPIMAVLDAIALVLGWFLALFVVDLIITKPDPKMVAIYRQQREKKAGLGGSAGTGSGDVFLGPDVNYAVLDLIQTAQTDGSFSEGQATRVAMALRAFDPYASAYLTTVSRMGNQSGMIINLNGVPHQAEISMNTLTIDNEAIVDPGDIISTLRLRQVQKTA